MSELLKSDKNCRRYLKLFENKIDIICPISNLSFTFVLGNMIKCKRDTLDSRHPVYKTKYKTYTIFNFSTI